MKERGSEEMEESEEREEGKKKKKKERGPGSLQQPSVTPALPGTRSNLSLEKECASLAPKNKAPAPGSLHASHSCRGQVTCPGS